MEQSSSDAGAGTPPAPSADAADIADAPPRRTGAWAYWRQIGATTLWAALAFLLPQAAVVAVVKFGFPERLNLAGSALDDGPLVALVTLIGDPLQIVLLFAIAYWRSRGDPLGYLGLVRFRWRDLVIGLVAIAACVAAMNLAIHYARLDVVTSFQTDALRSARAAGWVWPLFAAVVVVGPAGEELLFRGFLFRGWVTPDMRGVAAVVVITLLWSVLHIQYDVLGITEVFLLGLVLGWVRWRSGSTSVTIVLHMLVNLEATIETVLALRTGHT
jgi:hypothetical protein